MDQQVIQIPLSILLDRGLTASAKLLCVALRADRDGRPTELGRLTGLSESTVLRTMPQVRDYQPGARGLKVRFPLRLLASRTAGPQAKVVYGLLQATPGFRGGRGRFTYPSLSALTGIGPNALRRAVADLVAAGWVRTVQAGRLRPVHFSLGSPELRRAEAEALQARRRLKRAQYSGEALMQEYLSLLIDSDRFTDNARPGFLINPLTGERLELDRFYHQGVAFEMNGSQHYGATDRISQAEADAQRLRDLIKAGLCLYDGIQLVVVHGTDLSLEGMKRKVGQLLPLRDLSGDGPLIDLLEAESIKYLAAIPAAVRAQRRSG